MATEVEIPNILVFVNHADAVNFEDLYETTTGFRRTDTGQRIRTMTRIAEGWIGESLTKFDLYVWIDARTRCVKYLFNSLIPDHVSGLRDLLAVDPP